MMGEGKHVIADNAANSDLWAVFGQHVDEYNRIVKPDWVFTVPRYFLRRWVRHLGAGPAWLVVALRQWCYRNKDNWCMVGRVQLSQDIGVHEDTVSSFVAKGFAPWFIESKRNRSYDQTAGRPKQDFNLYVLLMDEPLAPEDFLAVERLLAEAVVGAADPVAVVQGLLRDLLAMPGPGLADHLDIVADHILPSAKRQRTRAIEALINRPERTVADLVETVLGKLPAASRAEMRELCSELQRKIVAPEDQHVGTHYFRLNWVPLLGHLLAWKVVALRSRCYWNLETKELRDECEVWPRTLAEELGCSAKWVKSLSKRPYAGVFLQVLESGKKKPIKYWVQMREPLTPDDQTVLQVLLAQEGRSHTHPGTGQSAMAFKAEEPEKGTLTALGREEKGTPALEKGTLTALGKGEKGTLAPEKGTLTAHIRILIEYLDRSRILLEHQQHADAFSVSADGGDAVRSLLDLLEIHGLNRARVLYTGLAPDAILAWVLNGLAQPDMGNLAGYVISQVLSADPTPPPQFLEFARLGPEVWKLFVALSLGDDQATPPSLRKVFECWDELFGSCLRQEARRVRWQEEQARRQEEKMAHLLDASETSQPVVSPLTEPFGGVDPERSRGAQDGPSRTDAAAPERKIWQAALGELQLQMTKATFDTWVRNTRLLSCLDDVFVIGAQNAFARDWLENRLLTTVKRTLVGIVGHPVEVQFMLEESPGEG
jgi:hypothetical protein